MQTQSKIGISLLINDEILNYWQFKIIENILETKNCNIDKIYYFLDDKTNLKPNLYQILKNLFVEILFFNADYLKKINIQQSFSLSQSQIIQIAPVSNLFDLAGHLKESASDLLINLSNTPVPAEATHHMKLGQAFFMFGQSRFVNLHYSAYRNPSQILIELVWINQQGAFVCNHGSVDKKKYSASETVDTCGHMTQDWIRPFLYRLLSDTKEKPIFKNLILEELESSYRLHLILIFTFNIALARFKHLFVRIRRAFTYQKWNIMITPLNRLDLVQSRAGAFKTRTPLFKAEWPKSYADPFFFKFNGKKYIIYETFDFKPYLGQISIAQLDAENKIILNTTKILFTNRTHFSYPCVFEHDDKVFVVPENILSQKVTAFELDMNSLEIVSEKNLLSGRRFVDPTIFFRDGYFWILFTEWNNYNYGSSKLYLYYAKSFEGPYTPHDLNPIVTDMSRARSAGNVFEHEGKIYRPSQDCLNRYGQKINISQIEKISTSEYQEKVVQYILPDANYYLCCHHMSLADDQLILDGQKEYFSFRIFFWKVKNFILTEVIR